MPKTIDVKDLMDLVERWRHRAENAKTLSHYRHPQHTKDIERSKATGDCADDLEQLLGVKG